VCVEADAGWVPHYLYRMDHAYKRHRNWLEAWQVKLERGCRQRVLHANTSTLTFQDDWVAFRFGGPDELGAGN
jgi:hypothetical protein